MFDTMLQFTMPTRLVYGYDATKKAAAQIKKMRLNKALLVTDKGIVAAGLLQMLEQVWDRQALDFVAFDDCPADPNLAVVDQGLALLKQNGCDSVIVLGGGSPLCAGKAIALLATNGGALTAYEGFDKNSRKPLPVIAIPTTAGSGSEVSGNFIITDEQRGDYKMTIGSYDYYPELAILDPVFLRDMPAGSFLLSGMDALSHAVEALSTNQGSPLTDCLAYEAVRIIVRDLPRAALSGDMEAKMNQLLASSMANIACGNAKLALVHAMAQPLGSFHLPHGLAIGILLPYIMEHNLPACVDKYAHLADVLGISDCGMNRLEKAESAIAAIRELYRSVDFPDRIPADKVPESAIPKMAAQAMTRPQLKTNIRRTREADVARLYARAYQGYR